MSGKNLGGKTGRRGVLKRIGVIATAGTAAGAGVVLTQQPGMAIDPTSFSASDLSYTSNSGEVQSLTLQPDLDYNWTGLDNQPQSITFTLSVKIDGSGNGFSQVAQETEQLDSTTALTGSAEYTFGKAYDIVGSGPLDEETFEPSQKGNKEANTKTTTVGVEIVGDLSTTNTTYSSTRTTTYDVSITNKKGSSQTGGSAGTGGSVGGPAQ